MIVNDLQRLRWQILDECLRDTTREYFMGNAHADRETDVQKSLLKEVKRRLHNINRNYKCSKRQLQLDVALFENRGGKLEPRFRRGHKRILRFLNLQWKNPLLRNAPALQPTEAAPTLQDFLERSGTDTMVLRLRGKAQEEIGHEWVRVLTTIDEQTFPTLLSFAPNVEVIEPSALRNEFLAHMRAIINAYEAPFDETNIQAATPLGTAYEVALKEKEEETKKTVEQTRKPKAGEQLDLFDLFG